ncbi:MAG: hypothetical protein COA58_03620 [Bacteroidetes bacterium]|nr:MAG: hypothetical protein COA58_03620 [Bacteroidota bacterium]
MSSQDHSISLLEAAEMTKRFRDANPQAIKAGKFSKEAIASLTSEVGYEGLRIYYAETAAGENALVLVAVDAAGNDLYNGYLADHMKMDPPITSSPNPLNS